MNASQIKWSLIPRGNTESRGGLEWSKRLPGETEADGLTGHSLSLRLFPWWFLCFFLNIQEKNYWLPISTKKSYKLYNSLNCPVWSTLPLLSSPLLFSPSQLLLLPLFTLLQSRWPHLRTLQILRHRTASAHMHSSPLCLDHFILPGPVFYQTYA